MSHHPVYNKPNAMDLNGLQFVHHIVQQSFATGCSVLERLGIAIAILTLEGITITSRKEQKDNAKLVRKTKDESSAG
jgi:hypothetical protein